MFCYLDRLEKAVFLEPRLEFSMPHCPDKTDLKQAPFLSFEHFSH